jgi:hypothetical protein
VQAEFQDSSRLYRTWDETNRQALDLQIRLDEVRSHFYNRGHDAW